MEALTLLSKNDIQEMVNAAVADALKLNAPKPIVKTNFDINEAPDYLAKIGYKCSTSQLYKLTATDEIAFTKFGRKISFSAEDLTKWVESRKQKTIDITMAVARSANNKLGRN